MTEKQQAKEKKTMGHSVPDDAWLSQVSEDALEPDVPIIDPHHHLWLRNGHRYLLPELLEDMASGHNIVATVFAECHSMYRPDGPEELKSLGETEFVAGTAAMSESGAFGPAQVCAGMFGRVDMTLGARTEAIFDQHLEKSGGRFRGIRFSTAWDPSPKINNVGADAEMLRHPDVVAAAKIMAAKNLSLDSWVYHPQLEDIVYLANTVPDLTIILNHCGVPILGGPYRDKRDEVFEDWKRGMEKVAKCPNVFIKVGGLPILRGADVDRSVPPGSEEIVAAWAPWMHHCIEAFGPERSMFESNFPVQKLWSSYAITWNAFKRLAVGASADEKQDLFYGAATRAYRLDL